MSVVRAADVASSLAGLLDSVGAAIIVWRLEDPRDDRSLTLEQLNDVAATYFAKPREALVGGRIDDLVPIARSLGTPAVLARVALTGEPFRRSTDLENQRFDSVYLPLNGNRVVSIFENVTARRALEQSLEFQAQLLAAVEQAVIATNLEGRITFWSRFAEELYGWSSAEAVGRSIVETVGTGAGDETAIMASVREQGTWSGESHVRRKNGSTFSAFVTLSPILRDGVVTGLVGVSRDITEQKRAEDVLRASEARYRALVNATPDLIFRIGRDYRYIDYAGPTEHLIVPSERFIGRVVREIAPPEIAAVLEQSIDRALSTGRPTPVEYELDFAGEIRAYEAVIAPNGPDEVLAVVREVTDRKRDQAAIEELARELEARVIERTRDLQRTNEALLEQMELRREAEEASRASYARLQTLINASPAAIVELDRGGKVLSWNQAAERLFGWTAMEAIGRFNPIVPEDRVMEFHGLVAATASGVTVSSVPVERRNRAGAHIPVAVSAAPVRDAHGPIERLLFMYTKREGESPASTFDELATKVAKLRSLSSATAMRDMRQTMEAIERELAQNFGISAGAVYVRDPDGSVVPLTTWGDASLFLYEAMAATDVAGVVTSFVTGRKWFRAALQQGAAENGVLVLQLPEGEPSPDEIEFLTAVAHDVAAAVTNARLFEQVHRANEQLQDLSRRLVSVQEEERRSIGRELHDQIGQMLTGLKLRLAGMRGNADHQSIEEAEQLVGDLLNRVRTLSLELRPPMLDDGGLIPALRWHVDRYTTETGMPVDFRHGDIGRFNSEIETAVFRIIQEGMTNVARHARAKRLTLRLWCAADRLLAELDDDGAGFSPPDSATESAGLTGMRERAALVSGTLVIDSQPGVGTRILLDVPAGAR